MVRWIKRIAKILLGLIAVLVIVYLLGPTPDTPELKQDLPDVATDLEALEQEIIARESADSVREGNGARIVWADPSRKEKTPYSVLYLHGFSASPIEGAPLHEEFAKRYGCNLYLARLADHGLVTEEPMLHYSAERSTASAKEALAIAQQLGDSVIIMSCSTGGTLAIWLAAGGHNIAGLINYSPNIGMADGASYLLNKPWGLDIANAVFDGDYYEWEGDEYTQKYWYTRYRIEALVQLQELIEETMTEETFAQVKQPFFVGYFYKNDSIQDNVVSVSSMMEMYDQIGTADELKHKTAFPEAGVHVINSGYKSQDFGAVQKITYDWAEATLGLQPK